MNGVNEMLLRGDNNPYQTKCMEIRKPQSYHEFQRANEVLLPEGAISNPRPSEAPN